MAQPLHVVTQRSEPDSVIRVDLAGSLNGRHILVDDTTITFGWLEDCQSGEATKILDALSRAVVGGDLIPQGTDPPTPADVRAALRQLYLPDIKAMIDSIGQVVRSNPKRAAQ